MKERDPEARAVFLVGFMGAGKTSVGRALSERLGWPFEDLDDRIRALAGRSIDDIFQHSGEAEFRRMEHAALQEIVTGLGSSPRVIGLGGGAFVQVENAKLLQQAGASTVFLDAAVEELWRRCQGDAVRRPLQKDEQAFRSLYAERRQQYLTAAVCLDTTGKTVEMVAAEVALRLGLKSKVS